MSLKKALQVVSINVLVFVKDKSVKGCLLVRSVAKVVHRQIQANGVISLF